MKTHLETLSLCIIIVAMPISSYADESNYKTTVNNAVNSVILECNNYASRGDLKVTNAFSQKTSYTEKQKKELQADIHNYLLHSCLTDMASGLMKYSDSIKVKAVK